MKTGARHFLFAAIAVVLAFGIGAAWQFNAANRARAELADVRTELEATRLDLVFDRLEATLAMATIASQLGNFERARQLTSEFFTGLQERSAAAPETAQSIFSEILGGRDGTITLLSRAQPEAGLELARMLSGYRRALGRDGGDLTPSGPAAAADTSSR